MKQSFSCPGRGAAYFTMHRRAGTHGDAGLHNGPRISSAPLRAAQHPGHASVIPAQRLHRCPCATASPLSLRNGFAVVAGGARRCARLEGWARVDASCPCFETLVESASPADAWNPVAEQPVFFPDGRSGRWAMQSRRRKSRSSDLHRPLHRQRAISGRWGCGGWHHRRDGRRR